MTHTRHRAPSPAAPDYPEHDARLSALLIVILLSLAVVVGLAAWGLWLGVLELRDLAVSLLD